MTSSPRLFLVVVAFAALLVSGCGSSTAHDDADVAFATGMVPHHRQAVEMSDLLLAKTGVDDEVRALATTIKGEQAPEIEQMTGWLKDWGAPAPAGMDPMGGMGDGMMSAAEMDALTKAEGRDAQTRFLTGMVKHHRGAVAMAQTEIAAGRDDDAKTLAKKIVSSQQAEIDQMTRLLAS